MCFNDTWGGETMYDICTTSANVFDVGPALYKILYKCFVFAG